MDTNSQIDHLVEARERLLRLEAATLRFKARTVLRASADRQRRDNSRLIYKTHVDNRLCRMTEPERKRWQGILRRAYKILGR